MEEKEILKVGDIIEWNLGGWVLSNLKGNHRAKIAMVDMDKKRYGVFADYGQDMIPFDECVKIKEQ
jgi:hypothetical protein